MQFSLFVLFLQVSSVQVVLEMLKLLKSSIFIFSAKYRDMLYICTDSCVRLLNIF